VSTAELKPGPQWVVRSVALVLVVTVFGCGIGGGFVGRAKLTRKVLLALTYVLAVWIGSATLLLPGRSSSLEERFGAAYPDARPLSFAWACGFLAAAATLLLTVIAVLLLKGLRGTPTTQHLQTLSRASLQPGRSSPRPDWSPH
jgi:hypothetical protein